jgi:hypothetical protein
MLRGNSAKELFMHGPIERIIDQPAPIMPTATLLMTLPASAPQRRWL